MNWINFYSPGIIFKRSRIRKSNGVYLNNRRPIIVHTVPINNLTLGPAINFPSILKKNKILIFYKTIY